MARRRKEHSFGCERNGLRDKPIQRNAANARERARMRVLSKAFSRLKTTLPWVPADTKLSKLDTLRLAASYIAHLRQILVDEAAEGTMIHPINLTWPFTFNAARSQDAEDLLLQHSINQSSSGSQCSLPPDLLELDYNTTNIQFSSIVHS